jgi:hypothetical protein
MANCGYFGLSSAYFNAAATSLEGACARQIPAQEGKDSASDRAELQARLRMRGLPFPLLLCMSYLPVVAVKRGNGPSGPRRAKGATLWTGSWNHAEDAVLHQRVTAKQPGRVRDSDSTT